MPPSMGLYEAWDIYLMSTVTARASVDHTDNILWDPFFWDALDDNMVWADDAQLDHDERLIACRTIQRSLPAPLHLTQATPVGVYSSTTGEKS